MGCRVDAGDDVVRWALFGLGWLALVLLVARVVGGAARLGGSRDPRRENQERPTWICPKCKWRGEFGEAAFKMFVDDQEPYCPECGSVLGTGL